MVRLAWMIRALVVATGLAACSPGHQYLVLPGTSVTADPPQGTVTEAPAPVVTTTSTATVPAPGQDVTWSVDFTSITTMLVVQILVVVEDLDVTFVHDLDQAEVDAGVAELVVTLAEEPPREEVCTGNGSGGRVCYAQADEGTTGGAEVTAGDGGSNLSAYAGVGLTFPPVEERQDVKPLNCSPASVGGCNLQACCSPTQCEYRVNGQVFPCDGTDCTAAVSAAVQACL